MNLDALSYGELYRLSLSVNLEMLTRIWWILVPWIIGMALWIAKGRR